MKDRIKKLMESLHMTQQVFAEHINISPASLSSIFTGRTRPTLATVEAIKNSIPNISTDWLMFGSGSMYVGDNNDLTDTEASSSRPEQYPANEQEPASPATETSPYPTDMIFHTQETAAPSAPVEKVKYIDKSQRKITEIRIFYDDQTWETFVPQK